MAPLFPNLRDFTGKNQGIPRLFLNRAFPIIRYVKMGETALMAVRTVIVDDNSAFLNVLSRLLATGGLVEVVARAMNGREALQEVSRHKPDLVLIDMVMPEIDGLEATRRMKQSQTPPRVVILTVFDHPEYRRAAAEAGADDFLPKGRLTQQLLPAITKLFPDRKTGVPLNGSPEGDWEERNDDHPEEIKSRSD